MKFPVLFLNFALIFVSIKGQFPSRLNDPRMEYQVGFQPFGSERPCYALINETLNRNEDDVNLEQILMDIDDPGNSFNSNGNRLDNMAARICGQMQNTVGYLKATCQQNAANVDSTSQSKLRALTALREYLCLNSAANLKEMINSNGPQCVKRIFQSAGSTCHLPQYNNSPFGSGSFNMGPSNQGSFGSGSFGSSQGSFGSGPSNQDSFGSGSSNSGSFGSGSFGSGSSNQGSFGSGSSNSGSFGSGSSNSGSFGSGSSNSGSFSSGSSNQGSFGSGFSNQGSFGSGSSNSGSSGSGSSNSGSFSSGSSNQGSFGGSGFSNQGSFGSSSSTQRPFGSGSSFNSGSFGSGSSNQGSFGSGSSNQGSFGSGSSFNSGSSMNTPNFNSVHTGYRTLTSMIFATQNYNTDTCRTINDAATCISTQYDRNSDVCYARFAMHMNSVASSLMQYTCGITLPNVPTTFQTNSSSFNNYPLSSNNFAQALDPSSTVTNSPPLWMSSTRRPGNAATSVQTFSAMFLSLVLLPCLVV